MLCHTILRVAAAGELSAVGLRALLQQPTLVTIASIATALLPSRTPPAPAAPLRAPRGGARQPKVAAFSVSFADTAVVLPHTGLVPSGYRADGRELELQVCCFGMGVVCGVCVCGGGVLGVVWAYALCVWVSVGLGLGLRLVGPLRRAGWVIVAGVERAGRAAPCMCGLAAQRHVCRPLRFAPSPVAKPTCSKRLSRLAQQWRGTGVGRAVLGRAVRPLTAAP